MNREAPIKYPDNFLVSAFELMRQKLLDVSSGRSRLLHLEQNSKSFVRIVDELPNELIRLLLAEKSMLISPIPEPKLNELIEHGYLAWDEKEKKHISLKKLPVAKEWASLIGIDSNFELKDSAEDASGAKADPTKENETHLQAIQFEAQLTVAIKKLASEAKTAIDETGNNILFLCLGFLEWEDHSDSGKTRQAPLYLLPITIDKEYRQGIDVYTIKYNGEDIIPNLILREKLQQEFGLTLPKITDPENEEKLLMPEEYFAEVNAILARKQNDNLVRNWKVRRFATIATLSLGKLLMYRDLDPRNWPEGEKNILEHEVIKRFFQDSAQLTNASFSNESYVLDNVENIHDSFPMIEDADSSQMSVLIDVLNGKHLVVEGPPGTGKSQTITNIIAAALSKGKTVLFVAEKQAALDVVKRRMDKVGLGDFCLDLHSDKAQKRLVLDGFKQRMANASRFKYSESDYLLQVERYETAREKLQQYVLLINNEWKNTGLSIHEILMAATRFAEDVSPLSYEDIAPDNINGTDFSRVMLDNKIDQLELFYDYLTIVIKQLPDPTDWSSHPWFGVENKLLTTHEDVASLLKAWNDDFAPWYATFMAHCYAHKIDFDANKSMDEAEHLLKAWCTIPPLEGAISFSGLQHISAADFTELDSYIIHHQSLAERYLRLNETFTKEALDDSSILTQLENTLAGLSALGVSKEQTFYSLLLELTRLTDTIYLLELVDVARKELLLHLPASIQTLLDCTLSGLRELAIMISLAQALPAQYVSHRDGLFDNEELPDFVAAFDNELNALKIEREKLEAFFSVDKLPSVTVLQNYATVLKMTGPASWLKPSWRDAKKAVTGFSKIPNFNCREIAEKLEFAANWAAKCTKFAKNTKNNQLLKGNFQGLNTDVEQVVAMVNWYQKVRTEYGIGFGKRVVFAQALFTLPTDIFRGIQDLYQHGLTQKIDLFNTECKKLASVFTEVACFSADDVDFSEAPKPFIETESIICASLINCDKYLLSTQLSLCELTKEVAYFTSLKHEISVLEENSLRQRFSDINLSLLNKGCQHNDLQILIDTLSYAKTLYARCKSDKIIKLIKNQPDGSSVEQLQLVGDQLIDQYYKTREKEETFFNLTGGSRESWFKFCGDGLNKVTTRNDFAIKSSTWLDGWIKYLYAKERMEQGGYTLLNQYLSKNTHTVEYARNAMKFATYHSLAQEIYQEKPELSQMSGHEQTALQQQFVKYDEKLKVLQRLRVAALAANREVPVGTCGARAESYTDNALLEREIAKKNRHISIRHLVTRAGDAMLAHKPCFMMSPMAVAKYIPPGSITFDIVVMDEASQVKPQDALSCFARGKQIVVVGDSKQLPPTSFFEKSLSNDVENDDEERGVIDEAESILDAVGAYFDKRQLRWHYRSRHESLIEFSNHKFYDGNLVVFPSPWSASEEYGIQFNHIRDGRFIHNVNHIESLAVVAAIRDHLINKNHESLGVVAMNAKQRDMIEADLEREIVSDPRLRTAYEANRASEDPLFIKNLENVQGDERDVIYISFTYGPQEKGGLSIPQRFGPINGSTGWRRLNVLFTRAKKRIQVYSSMTADQVVLTENTSLGLTSLKEYLQFAQTGRLHNPDSLQGVETDSDFEIAVMNALSKSGFECVPQVGVAGFFIDIAVRDPAMPGRYLMGIECDGATYHSSKSTRDRDRVRQGVLEELGWTIRRIWSTDWFKHPDAELKPIIDELRRLATPIIPDPETLVNENQDASIAVDEEEHPLEVKTLKEALLQFNEEVIAIKYPNTAEHLRLLRPDMVDHLVLDRPLTNEEFSLVIPGYLRKNISVQEAKEFLDDVLDIVADYQTIEVSLLVELV